LRFFVRWYVAFFNELFNLCDGDDDGSLDNSNELCNDFNFKKNSNSLSKVSCFSKFIHDSCKESISSNVISGTNNNIGSSV
jgi:hypothetical protein